MEHGTEYRHIVIFKFGILCGGKKVQPAADSDTFRTNKGTLCERRNALEERECINIYKIENTSDRMA